MPVSPIPKPSFSKSPLRKLLLLTAIVVTAHLLILGSMPSSVSLQAAAAPEVQPLSLSVVAQSKAPAPIPASLLLSPELPPTKVRTPAAINPVTRATPQRPATINPAPAIAPPAAASGLIAIAPLAATTALTATATTATTTTTAAVAIGAATEVAINEPKLPATPATKPVADIPRDQKLTFAPPVLLMYEGRGEERGFIKYAASGELLWAPEGSRYNAHLEISAMGFRVRTWTSKGDLSDAGLQPLRFGDKPRGAELATHFQREKGIISFSANNPDVPLQTGAQDKLSAILQLSAIVAGEPARYVRGATIAFQAADAHRAELWNFKVGATEPLELPGGMLNALKLSKEPTVDFDQRIEVWLAPDLRYMPVRIRITEANGAYADLLWRKSQKPE